MSLPALNCKDWVAWLSNDGTAVLRNKSEAKMANCSWDPDAAPVKDDYKAKSIMYGAVAGGWRAKVLESDERALLFREGKYVAECKVQWPVLDQLEESKLPAHHVG